MNPSAWYAILIVLALVILSQLDLDKDPGPAPGYTYPRWDRWSWWHLLGSMVLGLGACILGVSPLWSFLLTVAAGVGWEVVHGYVSWWDIIWDAIGAAVGAGVGWLAV